MYFPMDLCNPVSCQLIRKYISQILFTAVTDYRFLFCRMADIYNLHLPIQQMILSNLEVSKHQRVAVYKCYCESKLVFLQYKCKRKLFPAVRSNISVYIQPPQCSRLLVSQLSAEWRRLLDIIIVLQHKITTKNVISRRKMTCEIHLIRVLGMRNNFYCMFGLSTLRLMSLQKQ